MKFKLDENLGRSALEVLIHAGHDAESVLQEGLGGTDDENLFRICQLEGRALITLDHDFGQTLRFPPKSSCGIAVLELPRRLNPQSVIARLKELLILIDQRAIHGELWIVEPGRVRIHDPDSKS
jgi:predicted nuclease of predicted toxin-antitoxin system